ncbi:Asp-tRNA(Asn)/Glu-tRNA(Gln) amidotransferase subunit GatA [Limnochorda pilosa]|uniref:Glutamyl-tRNA(Gln) amidotransferase subunit A n=1 Tax=Limnochorda pilosa TaxID=1555112 RepID=A0A0K2SP93_LIMPI|nr:Asp-tRNA(Asn)/Glu-tRNA(Gln) amidotransferase subunit GatA [Limnochorda pilosa]BAS28639.1 glutamyl-tRNA(Gln) amidotransferase [Limnochorda pilosa]
MHDLYRTAHEIAGALARRELSAREVTGAFLARLEALEPMLHAFLTRTPEAALAEAEEVDRRRARGQELHPLAGIPIALKDNLCTRGVPTTAGSRILEGFRPPYHATVVERIAGAGLPVAGKTNLDEFAMGSSTENSAFGPTRNPWDLERVPGGSSGGSAAAVAAGQVPWALGSDTGGSIRQPAAYCGVVGLKPTYGRVSRFGLIAFASSLDQIGPITRDVTDAALLLELLAGKDPLDATSVGEPVPEYARELRPEARGLRIGLPVQYFGEGIARDVRERVRRAAERLASEGARVKEVSLPSVEHALACYYVIAPAEASSNLARYDGVRYGYRARPGGRPPRDVTEMFLRTRGEGFGAEVKRRIMLGTYALSAGYYDAYYLKAQKVRTLIRQAFDRAFQEVDVLVTPTTPTPAFRLGEKTDDPVEMYLNDICTVTINLAGLPAISLPCGRDGQGLPVGLQVIGRPFDETGLLQAAYAFEQAAGCRAEEPPEPVALERPREVTPRG